MAEYDYDAEDANQLTFKEGDCIVVTERDDSGWWAGKLKKDGLYVLSVYETLYRLHSTEHFSSGLVAKSYTMT